jgi:hypothetical protein
MTAWRQWAERHGAHNHICLWRSSEDNARRGPSDKEVEEFMCEGGYGNLAELSKDREVVESQGVA